MNVGFPSPQYGSHKWGMLDESFPVQQRRRDLQEKQKKQKEVLESPK